MQTSLIEAQIAMLDFQAARWLVKGEVASQAGNDHPISTPTGVFATADGHITLAAAGTSLWERFCKAAEAPQLFGNPDYATGSLRTKHRARLNTEIAEIIRARSSDEWVRIFTAAGVPAGQIYSIDQTFADPQVKHLGIAKTVRHPRLGDLTLVGQPHSISDVPRDIRTATPELGEHTHEILCSLGYQDTDIEQLRSDGIV